MPLDLAAYFNRIAYHGKPAVTLDVLHALTRAHTEAIPFETMDVLRGVPIELEVEALFDKLVRCRRGGYCFEQNGLFLAVLQQLGFAARPLAARVRVRTPDRNEMPARTHLLIAVELGGEKWLTDVGFGGFSLTCALRWQAGLEQTTPHDRRRLMLEDGRWFHQVWQDGAWLDACEFWGEEMPLSDRKVANWYTSTHPDSTFMDQLIVTRALANGRRLALLGDQLRERDAHRIVATRTVTAAELPELLEKEFAVSWPAQADAARLLRGRAQQQED